VHKRIVFILIVLCVLIVSNGRSDQGDNKKILSEDNTEIALNYLENGRDKVIIIAHGFYNNKDTVLFQEISDAFSEKYDVITFDFRGHGKSDGLFTWTAKETQDLRAVINYAKEKGYKRVGVVGFSLGAAITLIEGSQNSNIDSIVSVSAPSDFWKINYRVWEDEMLKDLKLNMGPKGKGKGIRPGNPFMKKTRPIDVVVNIAPIPVLFVHGEKDWLIASEHSERLYNKAQEPKALEIIKNAGHAEKIFDSFPNEFNEVCLRWFEKTL